jgi:hypothetical protein
MTPLEPTYYFNFFSLVFLSAIVAIVGGNNGIALGRLIQRNRWLTDSSVRLLRLGMWLPFFLLWSYGQILAEPGLPPIFRIFPFSLASGNRRDLFMLFAGLLAMTTVLFGSCYHYLTRKRVTQSHHNPDFRLHLQREIFLLAFLLCLVWQSFWGSAWPFQLGRLLQNLSPPVESSHLLLTTGFAMVLLMGLVFVNNRPFRWRLQLVPSLFAIMILLFVWSELIKPVFMYITVSAWLAMFLLMAIVLVSNIVARWSLDNSLNMRRRVLFEELNSANRQSLLGVLGLTVLGLLTWQILSQPLATYALIPRPSNVIQAIFSLLVTGGTVIGVDSQTMLWPDIRLSLLEICAGIVWAGLFAVPTVAWCYHRSWRKQGGALLSLGFISPFVLYDAAILWLGIGFIRRAFIVSCFAYFPMLQAFWSYRQLSMSSRVLLAIEESLPYAFVGLLTAEFIATEGLGFFILMASAKVQGPEAFAGTFILFGILAVISAILRWAVKQEVLQVTNAATAAQPIETLEPAI